MKTLTKNQFNCFNFDSSRWVFCKRGLNGSCIAQDRVKWVTIPSAIITFLYKRQSVGRRDIKHDHV